MTYEFKCKKSSCKIKGKIVERVVPVSESKTQVCSECYTPLSRVWSVPSIKTNDNYKG